jgi:hypothetical protein
MRCLRFWLFLTVCALTTVGCNGYSNSSMDLAKIKKIEIWCQDWIIPHHASYERLLQFGEKREINDPRMLARLGGKLSSLKERIPDNHSLEAPWIIARVIDMNGEVAELRAAYEMMQFDNVSYELDKRLVNLLILWSGSECAYFPGSFQLKVANRDCSLVDFDPFEGNWSETIP